MLMVIYRLKKIKREPLPIESAILIRKENGVDYYFYFYF